MCYWHCPPTCKENCTLSTACVWQSCGPITVIRHCHRALNLHTVIGPCDYIHIPTVCSLWDCLYISLLYKHIKRKHTPFKRFAQKQSPTLLSPILLSPTLLSPTLLWWRPVWSNTTSDYSQSRMYVRAYAYITPQCVTYVYLSIPSQSPKNLAQTILTYVSTHKGTTKLRRCVTARIKMTESHTCTICNIRTVLKMEYFRVYG